MKTALLSIFLVTFSTMVAQNTTTPGTINLVPNYSTAGITIPLTGDANNNATATVQYKKQSASAWITGHPLSRVRTTVPGTQEYLAGSLFLLDSATTYDVQVTISDPDGVNGNTVITQTVTTRNPVPSTGSATHYYVDAVLGSDNNTGTSGSPFKTITKGAATVQPGGVVHIRPGIYRETLTITSGGTANAYKKFVADGPGVIMDGSNVSMISNNGWSVYNSQYNIYSYNLGYDPKEVAVDGQRLAHYSSLTNLQNLSYNIPGGWHYNAGVLYVRTLQNNSPSLHTVNIPDQNMSYGIRVSGSSSASISYLVFEGITVRYYLNALISPYQYCSDIFIKGCRLYGGEPAVSMSGQGISRITFDGDSIGENLSYIIPDWNAMYNSTNQSTAIVMSGGVSDQVVVRNCVIKGFANGVMVGASTGAGSSRNNNVDIYNNIITEAGDDAIELDNSDINVKVWGNRVYNVFTCISAAPVEVGPCYVLRNRFYDYSNESIKYRATSSTNVVGPLFIYHNSITTMNAGNSAMEISASNHKITMKNNILVNVSGLQTLDDEIAWTSGYFTCNYNNYFRRDNATPLIRYSGSQYYNTVNAFFTATGQEQNGRTGDPLFINESSGDLRLSASSGCINTGIVIPGITGTYFGSAPEIGYWEFLSVGEDEQHLPVEEVRVWPIPAKDYVMFRVKGSGAGMVEVLDMSGRVIRQQLINDSESEQVLECSGMSAGIYFLRIAGVDNAPVRRFVIQ